MLSCSFAFPFCKKTESKNTLGKFPLCEPSAAVSITCPDDHSKACILVGDNEIKNKLFYFPIKSEKLETKKQMVLPLDGFEIQDIESITQSDKNNFLIFGSHSRNKKCKIKKSRLRFAYVRISENGLKLNKFVQTKSIKSINLFDSIQDSNNPFLEKVKTVIDNSEIAANKSEGNEEECKKVNSFNIEGSIYIQDNYWIGLRSPLVEWKGKKYAILLKLRNLDKLNFDATILLDLEGRGIRELSTNGVFMYGIAGGPEDGKNNFVLWKLPLSSLKKNAILKPTILKNLPKSSEGLAFHNSTIFILIDGDKGKNRCKKPGKFISIHN